MHEIGIQRIGERIASEARSVDRRSTRGFATERALGTVRCRVTARLCRRPSVACNRDHWRIAWRSTSDQHRAFPNIMTSAAVAGNKPTVSTSAAKAPTARLTMIRP